MLLMHMQLRDRFVYAVDLHVIPISQEKNPRFRESGDSDEDEEDDRKRHS